MLEVAGGSRLVKIAPSLLAADFARLSEEISDVERAGAEWLHLDVMDGHFVPNLTFGPGLVAAVAKVATATLDCHLMVTDPAEWLDPFAKAGAQWISVHVEARGEPAAHAERLRSLGVRPGLAINPDTNLFRVRPLLAHFDLMLVMSVFPGFGGQRFIPDVVPKIAELRHLGFLGEIQVDGGIDATTAGLVAHAGATVLVAGSSVFRAKDRVASIAALREAARRTPMTAET